MKRTMTTQERERYAVAFSNSKFCTSTPPSVGPNTSPTEKAEFHRPDTRPYRTRAESLSFSSLQREGCWLVTEPGF